jgi:hypothetical protein
LVEQKLAVAGVNGPHLQSKLVTQSPTSWFSCKDNGIASYVLQSVTRSCTGKTQIITLVLLSPMYCIMARISKVLFAVQYDPGPRQDTVAS